MDNHFHNGTIGRVDPEVHDFMEFLATVMGALMHANAREVSHIFRHHEGLVFKVIIELGDDNTVGTWIGFEPRGCAHDGVMN